jgi:hypothetical protein
MSITTVVPDARWQSVTHYSTFSEELLRPHATSQRFEESRSTISVNRNSNLHNRISSTSILVDSTGRQQQVHVRTRKGSAPEVGHTIEVPPPIGDLAGTQDPQRLPLVAARRLRSRRAPLDLQASDFSVRGVEIRA